MKIEIKILNKEFYGDNPDLHSYATPLPSYATSGSAAMDLVCTEDITIYPGETKMIPTGLAIWIGSIEWPVTEMESFDISQGYTSFRQPMGVAGVILPRSGLGGEKGLVLANLVGLIDDDYQGELMVQAWNRNKIDDRMPKYADQIKLQAGDRFCQLMFIPVIKAQWEIIEEFSYPTDRAQGGFGSTGD